MLAARYLVKAVLLGLLAAIAVMWMAYMYRRLATKGGYSEWSNWSSCTRTCGQGLRGRIRHCDKPTPGPLGKPCEGRNVMTEKCEIKPCPLDGGFSSWGEFGNCDKTCGGGKRERKRECNNPLPAHGGAFCKESSTESMACNNQPCPVDGGYSTWTDYSACAPEKGICGPGKKIRTRKCDTPVPAYGGKVCEGPHSEEEKCEIPCPTEHPPTTAPQKPTNTTEPPAKQQ